MFQHYLVNMEGLFSGSQPFQQKPFGNRKEEGVMKPGEKPHSDGGTTAEGKLDSAQTLLKLNPLNS